MKNPRRTGTAGGMNIQGVPMRRGTFLQYLRFRSGVLWSFLPNRTEGLSFSNGKSLVG
jgi:hypothetical protein